MSNALALSKSAKLENSRGSELAASVRFARRIFGLLLAEAGVVRWLFSTSVLRAVLTLVGPWLTATAIDEALPAGAPRLLFTLVLFLFLTAVCVETAGWIAERVSIVFFQRLEVVTLEQTLNRFLTRDFQELAQRSFGEASEMMGTAARATSVFAGTVGGALSSLSTLVIGLGFLALFFPGLVVVVLASGFVMALAAAVYSPQQARVSREALLTSCQQQDALHVLLRSLPSLRIANATRRAVADWRTLLAAQVRTTATLQRVSLARAMFVNGVPQLVTVAAIAWLVHAILHGRAALGQLLMALVLLDLAMRSVSALIHAATSIHALAPYLKQLEDLAFGHGATQPRTEATIALRPARDLVLDGVWYRYPRAGSENWALVDATLRIPEGKLTFLRGASGTGKSTQLRLLAGLLEPQRGQVSVLGRAPSDVRHLITYLPQQAFLLQASLADNLKLLSGRPLHECLDVARHTGLSAWLSQLPMGADTLVSSGGGNLSAGQRQLVLLTAAFASSRPVVLLDEPTSQLDEATKRRIDWAALSRGKTVAVVCHDDVQEGSAT